MFIIVIVVVIFVVIVLFVLLFQKNVSRSFYLIWQLGQPILFGLIGSALNIRNISGTLVGMRMGLSLYLCGVGEWDWVYTCVESENGTESVHTLS